MNTRVAARVAELRAGQGLSLAGLAERCGVSRSMISLVERAEASPTAVVLDRLATGLGVPLARLFEAAPDPRPEPVCRRPEQVEWRDPGSGYRRRAVSPPGFPSQLQLVEVDFPAGARVAYETGAREPSIDQQVWVLEGAIEIAVGDEHHLLERGDCLAMRLDRPIVFGNPTAEPARYLVAIASPAASPRRAA